MTRFERRGTPPARRGGPCAAVLDQSAPVSTSALLASAKDAPALPLQKQWAVFPALPKRRRYTARPLTAGLPACTCPPFSPPSRRLQRPPPSGSPSSRRRPSVWRHVAARAPAPPPRAPTIPPARRW